MNETLDLTESTKPRTKFDYFLDCLEIFLKNNPDMDLEEVSIFEKLSNGKSLGYGDFRCIKNIISNIGFLLDGKKCSDETIRKLGEYCVEGYIVYSCLILVKIIEEGLDELGIQIDEIKHSVGVILPKK